MGRPSKRTPEAEKRILDALRAGNYVEAACAYGGISIETYSQWRKKFPEFLEATQKAIAESEVALVATIRKDESWQSKAWLLERRFNDRWGKQKHDHNHAGEIRVVFGDDPAP
jgi:transposase